VCDCSVENQRAQVYNISMAWLAHGLHIIQPYLLSRTYLHVCGDKITFILFMHCSRELAQLLD
jgi:hypothetical protein